jgi:hypothetical protein
MTVGEILALSLPILVWGLILTKLSRHRLDPVALFCYCFAFFYLLRDVVITLGFDGPYPDINFLSSQTPGLVSKASVVLAAFLVAFALAYLLPIPIGRAFVKLVPVAWTEPTARRQARLTVILTVAATVISIILLARYGSFGGVVRAGKVTKGLAGSYILRIFPAVGAVVAASLLLTLWRERRETGTARRSLVVLALGAAILNAAYVMMWGSRTVVAIVLIILIAGQWIVGTSAATPKESRQARHGRPRVTRVVALVGLLIVAVVGLRVVRDNILEGHASSATQGQSEIRKLSVDTNSTYFDATLLAVRDWPASQSYRGGEDFVAGFEGIVPRAVWPNKPQQVLVGQWFRQVYQPLARNGWPLGATGDWYLNFGLFGVLVGGLLSGLLFKWLMAAWWRAAWCPFTVASMICVVVFVVPTGIEADTPTRWAQWALPLLACAWYLRGRRTTGAPEGLRELQSDALGSAPSSPA